MEWFKLLRLVVVFAFILLFLWAAVFIGVNIEQFRLSAVYAGLETVSFVTATGSVAIMYVATITLLLAVAVVVSMVIRRDRLVH